MEQVIITPISHLVPIPSLQDVEFYEPKRVVVSPLEVCVMVDEDLFAEDDD